MTSNNTYIGVDNGLSGAITVLQNNKIIEMVTMPIIDSTKGKREYDISAIILLFSKYPDATVVIEKSHAMPVLGVVQAFNFGRQYGIIVGIVAALKMRYHIVHARRWQKTMLADVNTKDTKQASAIVAQRLFPETNFRATERSKKIHDGLTDATLLAMYGVSNF
jgi:crossover junction endodeoxyribonuclease RuvC